MKTNAVYCGDCLEVLKGFENECVDLIYLDPPFFTKKHYEIVWKDGYEIRAFEDAHWYKDGKRQNVINVYVEWMRERLEQCRRVLKNTGSIYLYCDWHASHYLKVMMDELFGYNNFQNEIVWSYNVPVNSHVRFCRKHDTIFFYTKGNKWTFNEDDVRVPYGDWATGKKSYKTKSFGLKECIEVELNKKGKLCPDYWYIDIIGSNAKERLGYPTQKP